jgi:hypothetical protein
MYGRAIERGNLLVAETLVRELGRTTLVELLDLVALIAVKDPRRHSRAAARWLKRWLEADTDCTVDDVAYVTVQLKHLVATTTTRRSCRFGRWRTRFAEARSGADRGKLGRELDLGAR